MSTVLKMTDGTTTLDFIWHSVNNRDFMLPRGAWAPRVARRRRSQLGGHSPYEDVLEEITLRISGDSEAEVLTNQAALIALLDQAEQWQAGAPVAAVLLQYGISGGATYEAVVMGPGPGDESALGLTPTLNQDIHSYGIEVRLRVKRRGLWTLPPRVINYVANWSFEGDNSTTPGGWATTAVAPGVTVASAPAGTPQHGANQRSVQNTNAGGTAILYQDVSGLTVGASYRVSVYAYRSAGAGNARLSAYDGGGVTNAVTATTTAAAYTRLEVTKVCPAGGSIRVALEATGSTTAVFDAVLLETLPTSGAASPIASIDGVRSARVENGFVMYATFGESVDIPSPVRASVLRTNSSGTEQQGTVYPSALLIANSYDPSGSSGTRPTHLFAVGAAGLAGGGVGQYTAAVVSAVAAPFSRGGTVLRYTPTGTTEVKSALANAYDTGVMGGALVAFLVVQASVSNQFTVRGYLGSVVGSSDLAPAALVSDPVTVSGTGRQVIALRWPEVVANVASGAGPKFRISVQSTAAAGTLDVDTIAFLLTDQQPRIVRAFAGGGVAQAPAETLIASSLDSALDVSGLMSSSTYRLVVDPRIVSAPEGLVGITRSDETWDASLSHLGSPDLYLSGYEAVAVWLAPDAADWRYTSGGALVSNQLIVTRRKGALVPQ